MADPGRGVRAAGEMLVGPKRVLFMDEISTGLDSSTTYQVRREGLHRPMQQRTKHERMSQCALQADYLPAASAGPLPLTVPVVIVHIWMGTARRVKATI